VKGAVVRSAISLRKGFLGGIMSGKAIEFARIREAYVAMATEGRYRPYAPGDGVGSTYLTEEELADPERLNQEASQYAARFIEEEDSRKI
jgi:hypothetical protein